MAIYINGVSSDTVGLVVENYPARVIPRRKYSINEIPGRNGDIFIDEGTFENYTQVYDVYISDSVTGDGLNKALNKITAWLYPAMTQYATLKDDYDTTIYRKAFFPGGGDISNYFDKQGRGTLEFICQPQRFSISGATSKTYTGIVGTMLTITPDIPSDFKMPARPYLSIYVKDFNVDVQVSLLVYSSSSGTSTTTTISSFYIPKNVIVDNSLYYIIIDNEKRLIYGKNSAGEVVQISEDVQMVGDFFTVPATPTTADGNTWIRFTAPDGDFSQNEFQVHMIPNWWAL